MATPASRPRLRPIETIFVTDPREGRLLVLRDTQGVVAGHVAMPAALAAIVGRFTGRRTCEEIARDVSSEVGGEVPVDAVVRLATQLEDALYLHGPRFQQALTRAHREFADADVRPPSHAGGAYASTPSDLRAYLDGSCLRPAKRKEKGRLLGLIAPHIDPWRGAIGYGHAYGALQSALPEEADTFLLLGTSHAPMREPFALCRKAFHTPLGALAADHDAIDRLAAAASFDPYADQFNHKREHSLEFQAVFLKHVLGERPAKIIPVLAGLGEHQSRGTDPAHDPSVARFLDELKELVVARPGRVVVIAGADLAHVGPRFGDPRGYDEEERQTLEAADRSSLARAASLETAAFWEDVAKDLDTRRICGLAPIYSLLHALPDRLTGRTLHYEQTIDEGDGSIVSHAAMGFFE